MTMQVQEFGVSAAHGPTLMLLHGSPANPQNWRAVAKLLGDRFHLVLPTLLGYEDESGAPDLGCDVQAQAAALAPILRDLGPAVFVAAHSYGGAVAVEACRSVPVRGLVLLEPVMPGVLTTTGRDADYATGKATLDRYMARHAAGEPDAIAEMVTTIFGPGVFEAMPPPLRDYLRVKTAHNVRDVANSLNYRPTPSEVAQVAAPVTVVLGTRTAPFVTAMAEAVASCRDDIRLLSLDGANHAMLSTHAAEIAGLIAELSDRAASA